MPAFNEKSYFKIKGGRALQGSVEVSGAKNSVLPLLFSSLLTPGKHQFENVPDLRDVDQTLKMLASLGISYKRSPTGLQIENPGFSSFEPCPDSARSFRASILALGPLLAVLGQVKIPLPGGCEIGSRPIDIHLKGLKKLGARITVDDSWIYASSPSGLKASEIHFDFPSVGATENLIMASVFSQGTSYLSNVAIEPEIEDLIRYLKIQGARIDLISERTLKIQGSTHLKVPPKAYPVIPDRIEAGTWLIAGACTGGEILVKKCEPGHLKALLEKLLDAGFVIESGKSEVLLKPGSEKRSVDIQTGVYPLFPTDLQSQFMALMTQLEGPSSLEERVFEKRFRYIEQLNLLGAGIEVLSPHKAFVKGPVPLKGNQILASDLRAGAGLVLAALAAEGESQVYGLQHIGRGYDNFFQKLKSLRADVAFSEG